MANTQPNPQNPQGHAAVPVRDYGPCDNYAFWRHAFGLDHESDTYLKELMFTRLETFPFLNGKWDDRWNPTLVFLASMGRFWKFKGRNTRPDFTLIETAAIGETLGSVLSESYILNHTQSERKFVDAVKELMISDKIAQFTNATRAGYVVECALLEANANDRNSIYFERLETADRVGYQIPVAASWPERVQDIEAANIPVAQAMSILYYMASQSTARATKKGIDFIATIVVAQVKRGRVSMPFLDKIINRVAMDLNENVVLNDKVIRQMYVNYGDNINDQNIQDVFNRFEGQIPRGASRLGLTVAQATGGGMTAYFTIKKTITTHSGFNWAKVSLLLPNDWNNYVAAVRLVGNNAFYGFRSDLGDAKSTKYKNLAWVAKEICIRVDGDTAIGRYAGWVTSVPNRDQLDRMINRYIQERTNAIDDARVEAHPVDPVFAGDLNLILR